MDDNDFWELVAVLQAETGAVARRRLRARLESLPPAERTAFAERFRSLVFELDRAALFEQPVDADGFGPEDIDDDMFINVRVAITASGRNAWESVARDPLAVTSRHDWPISDAEFLVDLLEELQPDNGHWPIASRSNPDGWQPMPPVTLQDPWLAISLNLGRTSMRPWRGSSWEGEAERAVGQQARGFEADEQLAKQFASGQVTQVSVELVLTTSSGKKLKRSHRLTRGHLRVGADVLVDPGGVDKLADAWLSRELCPLLNWAASAVSIDG